MAISGNLSINIGLPNESTGSDSLYTAFGKINTNFNTLFGNASKVVAGNGITVTNNPSNTVISANLVAGNNIVLTNNNGAIVIESIAGGNGGGNITGVIAGTGLTGGGFSGNVSLALANTIVTPGVYNNPSITVDQYGRIIAASNNIVSGTVTSVAISPGAGIAVAGGPITSNGSITVTNTGVTQLTAGTGINLTGSNGNIQISATGGGGGVTSVGISSSQLVVSGSPIVGAGTITINLPNNLSITGNITANGRFVGDGSGLSNIAVANITGLGNVALLNRDGNGSNILYGNGVFASKGSVVGATGATGIGATGATGIGATGATGIGATGATGIGATGATGATGIGATGATGIGATGATGIGATGATGIGATGATGIGATGATGPVAGSNTQIVFNDTSIANGSANLTFNKITNILTVIGNINSGNASLGNAVVANYFTGNFYGTANTATTAGTVTTAAQPNITSVGTLSSLGVTGNVTAGNLVGIFANGTSNVNIPAINGNINLSAAGNSNIIVVSGSGAYINGFGDFTGKVSASSFLGPLANGTSNVRIPASDGNVNISVGGTTNVFVVTSTSANISGNLSVSANVLANNITSNNIIKTTAVLFASLPAAATAGAGSRSFITDGNLVMAGNFGSLVTGGGSNNVPVISDGTNWLIG